MFPPGLLFRIISYVFAVTGCASSLEDYAAYFESPNAKSRFELPRTRSQLFLRRDPFPDNYTDATPGLGLKFPPGMNA